MRMRAARNGEARRTWLPKMDGGKAKAESSRKGQNFKSRWGDLPSIKRMVVTENHGRDMD